MFTSLFLYGILNKKWSICVKLFRTFWFKCYLSRYKWYRKWYGGRWEYHWIDVCCSSMWLDMSPDKCWPEWRQPCSHGTPRIEDYPTR